MLYLFNGAKSCCGIPGKICYGCSTICDAFNCDKIRDWCRGVSTFFLRYLDKPLSTFVAVAWTLSLIELHYCVKCYTVKEVWVGNCHFEGDVRTQRFGMYFWLLVQGTFSLLNMGLAMWFQMRVWKQIYQTLQENASQKAGLPAEEQWDTKQHQPDVTVQSNIVKDSFKTVVTYDPAVILYFVTTVAAFVWSLLGQHWITATPIIKAHCNDQGYALKVSQFGLFYAPILMVYSLTWYFCKCCNASVKLGQRLRTYRPVLLPADKAAPLTGAQARSAPVSPTGP